MMQNCFEHKKIIDDAILDRIRDFENTLLAKASSPR